MTEDIFDKKVSKIVNLIINSKFISELANGTLQKEKFDFYILQDLLYLLDYSRYNKTLSSQCTSFFEKNFFFNEGIACENEYKRHEVEYKDRIKNLKPSPTCLLYTSYLARTLSEGNITNTISAFFSCPYIYWRVGKYLNSIVDQSNPYYKWIKEYEGGDESILNYKKILNERFKSMTDQEIDSSLECFLNTSRMEYLFWESAYTFEKWPDVEGKEVECVRKDYKSIVNIIENEGNFLIETVFKYKNISKSMISRLKVEGPSQVNVSKLVFGKLERIFEETSTKYVVFFKITPKIEEIILKIKQAYPSILIVLNLITSQFNVNEKPCEKNLFDMLLLNWSTLNQISKNQNLVLKKETSLRLDDIVISLMKVSVVYRIRHIGYFDSFYSHGESSLMTNSYVLYDGALNKYSIGEVSDESLSEIEFMISGT